MGGDVAAVVPLALVSGYAAGEAVRRYQGGDEGIPIDVDGTCWFVDPLEELREELFETYDIDTYGKQTVVPRRYSDR